MDKKETRARIHELLDMVLDANGMEERKRSLTGLKPTLFFRYCGHVNTLDIDLHSRGWRGGESADRTWWIWLDDDDEITDDLMNEIREAIDKAINRNPEEECKRRIAELTDEIEERETERDVLRLKLATYEE